MRLSLALPASVAVHSLQQYVNIALQCCAQLEAAEGMVQDCGITDGAQYNVDFPVMVCRSTSRLLDLDLPYAHRYPLRVHMLLWQSLACLETHAKIAFGFAACSMLLFCRDVQLVTRR